METKKKNASVYLLLSDDLQKFKIGKANNVYTRYKVLKKSWGEFNLEKSLQINCPAKQVKKLESILQFAFEKWNIDLKSYDTGHTEWFDTECFEQAKDTIGKILLHKSDIEVIEGIKLPDPPPERKPQKPRRKHTFNLTNIEIAKRIAKRLFLIEDFLVAYYDHPEVEGLGVPTFCYEIKDRSFIDKLARDLNNACKLLFKETGFRRVISGYSTVNSEYLFIYIRENKLCYYLETVEEPECLEVFKLLDASVKRFKQIGQIVCNDPTPPPEFFFFPVNL